MSIIYAVDTIVNIAGPICCVLCAIKAHKRHNTYARNAWFVATALWAEIFFLMFQFDFCR